MPRPPATRMDVHTLVVKPAVEGFDRRRSAQGPIMPNDANADPDEN